MAYGINNYVYHPLQQIISLSCHKGPPGLFAQYDTVHFGGTKQVSVHRGQTIQKILTLMIA